MNMDFLLKAVLVGALGLGTVAHSDQITSNETLRILTEKDQSARSGKMKDIDWSKVSQEDAERRKLVSEMLGVGTVRSAEDFYNAALIFQHGETADDIRIAYSLANISVAIQPEKNSAKWLSAAAWDRLMMRLGKPQWYGTQFTKSKATGMWELYSVDESAVSDTERKALGVPTLAQAKARASTLQ
jgi:hypothetical protein